VNGGITVIVIITYNNSYKYTSMCSLMRHLRSSYCRCLLFSCALPYLHTFGPYLYVLGPIASGYLIPIRSLPQGLNNCSTYLALSEETYQQFQHFNTLIENINLTREPDQSQHIWGTKICSPKKLYKLMMGHIPTHPFV
jgi:hypothetical protein